MRLQCTEYLGTTTGEIRLQDMWICFTKYRAFDRQPWHTHANPTFFLLLDGDHRDETKSAAMDQAPLALNYHPTHAPHRSDTGPAGMVGLNLELSPNWLRKFHLSEEDLDGPKIHIDPGWMCNGARYLALVFARCHDAEIIESLTLELISPFVRKREKLDQCAPRWLQAVSDRIGSEYAKPLSLAGLARDAAVHPVYLARAFRHAFGLTVTERILTVRMARACQLLASGMSAGEAALEGGFCDQFYLSRMLRAKYGVTPRELKAALRFGCKSP